MNHAQATPETDEEREFLELVDQLSPNEQAELATHLREIADQTGDHHE
jgi:hypothetical protein